MNRSHTRFLLALTTALVSFSAHAVQDPMRSQAPNMPAVEAAYDDKLLGSWGGIRPTLGKYGVEVELNYSGDFNQVVDGGKKRIFTYLDFIELRTNIDGEKAFGIPGNKISISVIDNNGTRTNGSTVGSTQGISNSEVASNGVRLYEAYIDQSFWNDRFAVLLGIHDLNTEFVTTTISDNFLVPTFQIGQSIAGSGQNGPSVYPTTSLAAVLKYCPTEESYVDFGVYDGIPGAPNATTGSAYTLGDKDGVLLIGEVGWTPKAEGVEDGINKLALGVWQYTGNQDDLTRLGADGGPERTTQQGMYVLASNQFYTDRDGRSLGGFVRGGFNEGDVQQVDWDYTAGIVANGWVPGRENGQIGLGVSQAHNADKYVKQQADLSTEVDRSETIFELYYRDQIARGISVQPNMVYVVNPGTDKVTDDAFVIGARLDINF